MLIRTTTCLINMDNVEMINVSAKFYKGTEAAVLVFFGSSDETYVEIAKFFDTETVNCIDSADKLIDMIMDAYERGARVLDLRTIKV